MDRDTHIKEFTELIEKNQGIVHKVSRMYCTGTDCKDDLFQDILLQLWRSYPNYDKTRKFSTWMYRVALNTAISQFRKESKIDIRNDLPKNIIDNNDVNEKNEQAQILHHAIRKLRKTDRSIIILYMDDYPYDEISGIIGISASNVGVKITRIKKKLQKILKELEYGF